jgi:hypothetical protein
MTRVRVVRTGGVAGLRRVWEAEAPDELCSGRHDGNDRCAERDVGNKGGSVDRFVYQIEAGDEVVELREAELTPAWQALIDHVVSAGRQTDG